MSINEIYNKIKPYIAKDFNLSSVGGTITQIIQQLVPHALSGSYHTGVLSKTQAPWVATDISDAITLHTSNQNAHHNKTHSITGSDHTVTGSAYDVVGLTGSSTLGIITPSSNPGVNQRLLKTDSDGKITLPRIDIDEIHNTTDILINTLETEFTGDVVVDDNLTVDGITTLTQITSPDDLTINPVGALDIDSGDDMIRINPDNTIQTDNFTSQLSGWRMTYTGELDTRYIYSDQMKIKKFIVDTEVALAGSEMISKSATTLARDIYIPFPGFKSYMYVEDLQDGENMACFEVNDFIKLSESSRNAGSFSSLDAWGTVSNYADQSNKQQRWNFTRSGTATINSITNRGSNTYSGTNATSFNIAKLSGTTSGDLIVLFLLISNIDAVITNSHGFLTRDEYIFGDIKGILLYKIAGGSEPSTYTFSSDTTIDYDITGHYFRNAAGIAEVAYSEFTSPTTSFISGGLHNLSDYDYLLMVTTTTGEPEYIEPENWIEIIDFATGVGFSQGVAGIGGMDNGFQNSFIMETDLSLTGFTLLLDIIPTYSGLSLTTGYLAPGTKVEKGGTVLDYGVSGNGYIESTTLDGAYGSNSPYIRIATWATHPTNKTVRTQIGHLRGIFSTANEYGLYAGDGVTANSKYLRLSSYTSVFNNIPIKMVTSSVERIRLDASYGLDLQLAATADTLTAITWRQTVGSGSAVVSMDAYDGGDSTQFIIDMDAISDSPIGVMIIRANNYAGTSTASLTLTANSSSNNSNAVLSGNAVGLGNSTDTNKITLRVKSTGDILLDGKTEITEGLYVTGTSEGYTTTNWGKALVIPNGTVLQWNKGSGSISRGIGLTDDNGWYFMRSTADDGSGTATYDMFMDGSGNLYLGVSGGFVNIGGRVGEAWLNLSFNTGWGNYGSVYQTGQYKKVGDMVFLRGLVKRTSGSATTIATLPSGYRPPAQAFYVAISSGELARIDIDTSGNIIMTTGTATYISLNGLFFSVI